MAGHHSDKTTQCQRNGGHAAGDGERDARAGDDTREHVTPEGVGSEEMFEARRLECLAQILLEIEVLQAGNGEHHDPSRAGQNKGGRQERAQKSTAILNETSQSGSKPASRRGLEDSLECRRRLAHARASLTRGSAKAYPTLAAKFAAMTEAVRSIES